MLDSLPRSVTVPGSDLHFILNKSWFSDFPLDLALQGGWLPGWMVLVVDSWLILGSGWVGSCCSCAAGLLELLGVSGVQETQEGPGAELQELPMDPSPESPLDLP